MTPATTPMLGWMGTGARALAARLGATERRAALLYGSYTLAVFGLCFLLTFPHDLLLQRALRSATAGTPVRIETGGAAVGWLRYGVAGLQVRSGEADAEPLLSAEQLEVAPSFLGLVRGTPYPVGIDAALYGGTLRGTIDPRPASFRIDAAVADVDLGRWSGARTLLDGGVLRGRLEARLALDGDGRGPAAAAGDLEIRVPGLAIADARINGFAIPELQFGDVHATGTVKNGRLEITDLVARGAVDIQGEGNVVLRAPVESSVLSLDLTLTPTTAASDGLRMAVNLIPGSKGEGGARRVAVGGTLGRPSFR